MIEFIDADGKGGVLLPDETIASALEGGLNKMGLFRKVPSQSDLAKFREEWDLLHARLVEHRLQVAARMCAQQDAAFMSITPQCEPLAVFNTPNPSGYPLRDIKATDIIDMLAKMRNTAYFDAEEPIIVEAK